MIISIIGVVRDGSVPGANLPPRVPFEQPLVVPRGEDLVVRLQVLRENGEAQDITAGTIKLGVRKFSDDADPAFPAVAAVNTTPLQGLADITIPSAQTVGLLENFGYFYDVLWTDGAAKRWQLVPRSMFKIAPIVLRPGE